MNNQEQFKEHREHAIVVVLGDIGHSPRMCYHALSLANHGVHVHLVGYRNSMPHKRIVSHPNISIVPMNPPPDRFSKEWPAALSLLLKFVWIFFMLFYTLLVKTNRRVSLVVLQNPPGIPSMLVCYMISYIKWAYLVIDWHNYTFSMLNTNFRLDDPSVRKSGVLKGYVKMASIWEGFWGQRANWNLCVSHAMREDLLKRWNVHAVTLYDKPPEWNFKLLSIEEQHNFHRMLLEMDAFKPYWEERSLYSRDPELENSTEVTKFTHRDESGVARLRTSRPLLLVSSTSWTEDEDFGILLDALKEYETHAHITANYAEKSRLPDLYVVITGKGPQKEYYLERISRMHFQHARILTAWLAAEDYPKMLACADLGVSLHTSTSGLDLPMKVVDMFGCSIPVLAKRFPAIGELVIDGVNGRLFDKESDLKQSLIELATGFPNFSESLDKLKASLRFERQPTWDEQWDASFWPLVQSLFLPSIREFKRWERFNNDENDQ